MVRKAVDVQEAAADQGRLHALGFINTITVPLLKICTNKERQIS